MAQTLTPPRVNGGMILNRASRQMTNLMISKATEAKAVATVWNMAAESLDPESYEALEKALRILCETRNIPKEILACEQRILSGKLQHNSDCETSNAPAYVCAPCDCDCVAPSVFESIGLDNPKFPELRKTES